MEGNTVLLQLMGMWMENAMDGLTQNDACYQKSMQSSGEYPKSRMGLAYQLGFSNCAELLLGNLRFKK